MIEPDYEKLGLEAFDKLTPKLVEAIIEKRREAENLRRPPLRGVLLEDLLSLVWSE